MKHPVCDNKGHFFHPLLFCRGKKSKRMVRNDVFGDEIGKCIVHGFSVRPSMERCVQQITSDNGNITQLSNAKNRVLISTFLKI